MKNKIFIVISVATLLLASSFFVVKAKQSSKKLLLNDNVEALASDDGYKLKDCLRTVPSWISGARYEHGFYCNFGSDFWHLHSCPDFNRHGYTDGSHDQCVID